MEKLKIASATPGEATESIDVDAIFAEVEVLRSKTNSLEVENKLLREKINLLIRQKFGSRSEKTSANQLLLALELEPSLATEELTVELLQKPQAPRTTKRKKTTPRLPEDIPVEMVIIDPEEVKENPENFRKIGEEVSEELDLIPQRYILRKTVRNKYVDKCDKDRPPIVSPLGPRLLEGSLLSPGLLTDILMQKYVNHLPLHRQEQDLKNRFGINLSRKTLSDWVGVGERWLAPIWREMVKENRQTDYLQVDETPVAFNQKKPDGKGKGYLWVSFSPEKNVVFEWHKTRGTKALETTLEGFKGTVQCDGYIAYKTYAKDCDDIALAGCWAHARRKFHEAATESPKQAAWFIHQIGLLYCIERRLRSAKSAPVIRSAVRSSQSAYILRRIKKALLLKFPKHLPKGLMGKAIAYCLNHWEQLCVFVENGVVEIDNNLVENFIRPSAVGKRNWLFIGHADAGNRAAVIYSILGTCRRLGINQAEYLREVFERLPAMKISEVSALTPLNWAKEKGRRSVKGKVVLNSNPSP